ncbi:MAG TPA: hypothetical protein VES89_03375 [Candidatus Competibacteraceae bacterium]|nr:hypothetical protein [Candidatus Competibacteraceae bacterium]
MHSQTEVQQFPDAVYPRAGRRDYHGLVLLVLCLSLTLSACALFKSETATQSAFGPPPGIGYSGMVQIGPDDYLVVHDTKAGRSDPRVGIIRVKQDEPLRYAPLTVDNWVHSQGPANDLESACALPGRPGELLIAESGYQKNLYGRIFHLEIRGTTLRVLGVLPLPRLSDSDKDWERDNYEGLACAARNDGKILLILGERGGSSRYPNGVLRWGVFDPTHGMVDWPDAGKTGGMLITPGPWSNPQSKRDISDLYLDGQGNLWAAASEDAGDEGPFRSVIYRAATVQADAANPIQLSKMEHPSWVLDGLKVEALAGPPDSVSSAFLSFATEDERLGGVWRPLFPPFKPK